MTTHRNASHATSVVKCRKQSGEKCASPASLGVKYVCKYIHNTDLLVFMASWFSFASWSHRRLFVPVKWTMWLALVSVRPRRGDKALRNLSGLSCLEAASWDGRDTVVTEVTQCKHVDWCRNETLCCVPPLRFWVKFVTTAQPRLSWLVEYDSMKKMKKLKTLAAPAEENLGGTKGQGFEDLFYPPYPFI